MRDILIGMRVAILCTDDVERIELRQPRQALDAAGATTTIISPHAGSIHTVNHDLRAEDVAVDKALDEVHPEDFDAVYLPGGALNADALRAVPEAQNFVRAIDEMGRPIGVICHGPWLLVSSDLVAGRTITSYHTIRDDIENAGGTWVNQEAVRDHNWVSSRGPRDIPAFNREFLSLLSEYGRRRMREAA